MAMARPAEWQVRLDYMRPEHLDLYDARYLVAPAGRAVPAGAVIRAERGGFALYEVPTSGYFALGTIAPPPADFASAISPPRVPGKSRTRSATAGCRAATRRGSASSR